MKNYSHLVVILILFASTISCNDTSNQDPQEVKNIVLLIGDGMGVAQVYAGMSVTNDKLNFERAQYIGFSITKSASHYTTDSGAGATAFSTGKKTYNGAIAIDTNGKPIKLITDYASENGISSGIVATCALFHATPAAFAVHNESRHNYSEIAYAFRETKVDLLIGGGATVFDTMGTTKILQSKGYEIQPDLGKINPSVNTPLLALPFANHPPSIAEGRDEKYLANATNLALSRLSTNEKGFFLMVEGSQIDWGGHDNNADYIITELLDFDKAVGVAFDFADKHPGTLVIVTADHETGGMSITNRNDRENKLETHFSTRCHSGVMVPIFAYGTGAQGFSSIMDNTEVFNKMISAFEF
jgi:alkaline phosphatase